MTPQKRFHRHLLELGLPVVGVAGEGAECEVRFSEGAADEERQSAFAERARFAWVESAAEGAARIAHAAVDSIAVESVIARAAFRRVQFAAISGAAPIPGGVDPETVLRDRTHDLIDEWLGDGTLAAEIGG